MTTQIQHNRLVKSFSPSLFIYLVGTLFFMVSNNLNAQKLKVVSSASIFHDMVLNIAKDKVDARSIVPIGGDPHLYEATPSDAKLVQEADLILINGMTFEGWIEEVIENSGTQGKTILITEGIQPVASLKYKNSVDPHAWMDASNGLIYIKNIANALMQADPENKDFYQKNHNDYAQKLKELDQFIEEQIQSIPEQQRVLITSHDAFSYFGKRYGIQNIAILGISTEADAQTSDILRVNKAIEEHSVPAIFIESTINPKMIRQIAQDKGVKIGGELFADSIGDEKSEGNSYYDMLKSNALTITKALKSEGVSETKLDQDGGSVSYWSYVVIALIMVVALMFMIKKMNK